MDCQYKLSEKTEYVNGDAFFLHNLQMRSVVWRQAAPLNIVVDNQLNMGKKRSPESPNVQQW
ncbi:hypothetical protein T08_10692 [Trichinella sp. T8]|nr:hypothetical protein T08_10692 [Trichinella sp. T8]